MIENALVRMRRRLSRAREIGPTMDRLFARDAIERLSEGSAERRAAGYPRDAVANDKRIAEIRAEFPELSKPVTPTPEIEETTQPLAQRVSTNLRRMAEQLERGAVGCLSEPPASSEVSP